MHPLTLPLPQPIALRLPRFPQWRTPRLTLPRRISGVPAALIAFPRPHEFESGKVISYAAIEQYFENHPRIPLLMLNHEPQPDQFIRLAKICAKHGRLLTVRPAHPCESLVRSVAIQRAKFAG